jgi:3-hydroxyisobutyrate dehydrogenase-like beta-hydroxyacid dehydrogenase
MEQAVAFLGLGSMGQGMARRLLKAGIPLTVWNRSKAKAEPLLDEGAAWAESPAQAVAPSGVAITMLSDDAALKQVAQAFIPRLAQGLHISMSTVGPDTSRLLAAEQARLGGALVAAPVFGRPDAAAAGLLFIPASGPATALERARPLLSLLGQRVEAFGEDAGAASMVKLCGNYLLLAATQALGESMQAAEANGLDRAQVMDFFTSTFLAAPSLKAYGSRVARRDFAPGGFKLSLAAKDLRLFSQQQGTAGLPVNALVNAGLAELLARGQGEQDATALARLLDEKKA